MSFLCAICVGELSDGVPRDNYELVCVPRVGEEVVLPGREMEAATRHTVIDVVHNAVALGKQPSLVVQVSEPLAET